MNALMRHPRRFGFVAFNVVVALLAIAWLAWAPDGGLAELPNLAVDNVGLVFLVSAWVVSWLAWIVMVVRSRNRGIAAARI